MALTATLTVTVPAPPEFLALRDDMARRIGEARATMPSGCEVVGPDFHAYAKVNAVCDKNIAAARDRLVAAARKLGLAPVGAPDISYGVHGGWDGPVTLWYQMRAQ